MNDDVTLYHIPVDPLLVEEMRDWSDPVRVSMEHRGDGIVRATFQRVKSSQDEREAIQQLMATHGHTLTPEQRAAIRGWLGRTA